MANATPSDDRPSAGDERELSLVAWCALSLLLLTCASEPRLLSRAAVLPSAEAPLLCRDAGWFPPVARIGALGSWPWIVVAFGGAVCLGILCRVLSRSLGFWTALLAAIVLSFEFRELHLIPAAIVFGLSLLERSGDETGASRKSLAATVLLLILALATTLEFGFVLLFWLLLILSRRLSPESGSQTRGELLVAGGIAFAAALGCWDSAFRAALLRPVNWWGIETIPGVFDAMAPTLDPRRISWQHVLLLLTMGTCWYRATGEARNLRQSLPSLFVFTCLGLLCGYYLWLSAIAVLLVPRSPSRISTMGRRHLAAVWAVGLLCALQLAGSGTAIREYLVAGTIPPRRIDPSRGMSRGSVLLLDLDRSSEWQSLVSGGDFSLILDDRWDICGPKYREYALLVRDLREMRAMLYMRTDGRFGGYLHRLAEWNPTIVVAESEDLEAIRNLSLSPHWKLMGVDAQTTLFGAADHPDTQRQIQRAARTMLSLEWPNRWFAELPENVIAASTPDDFRRVAAVLSAIRLPFAALRLLPPDDRADAAKTRAWSYLELAHRTYRNTGEHSLLDEFRALEATRDLERRMVWNADEIEKLRRSLDGLGLAGPAEEVFPTGRAVTSDGRADRSSDETTPASASDAAERAVREAILRGDRQAAREQLAEVPQDVRLFYEAMIAAPDLTNEQLARKLHGAAMSPELPVPLKSEALFYLAELAIEIGDRELAIQTLTNSEQLDPNSNWTPLRTMYVQQLQRR